MVNPEIKKVIEDRGVKLYDSEIVTEHGEKIFRIYITSKDGISLDKCSEITKIISPILDIDPPVDGKYILEVSSPGIDRVLTKIEHFQHSIGELAKIKLNCSKKLKCKILSVEQNTITVYDKEQKDSIDIDFNDIVKAKTYFQW